MSLTTPALITLIMINKTPEITNFLKKHYSPGLLENTKEELQLTSTGVLHLLFHTFPEDCIDDYDLHEILTLLGYEPQKKAVNEFVWCLLEND